MLLEDATLDPISVLKELGATLDGVLTEDSLLEPVVVLEACPFDTPFEVMVLEAIPVLEVAATLDLAVVLDYTILEEISVFKDVGKVLEDSLIEWLLGIFDAPDIKLLV